MATDGSLTTTPNDRTRTANTALRVVQVLLAVFFLAAAAGPKLLGEQTAVEMFTEIGAGQWFRYLVGTLELAGAIGLLLRRWTVPAAWGLTGLMVGAVLTQIFVLDAPVMATTPAILGAVCALIAWNARAR